MEKSRIFAHQWLTIEKEGKKALDTAFLYENERLLLKEIDEKTVRVVDLLRHLRWTLEGSFQDLIEKSLRLDWIRVHEKNPLDKVVIPDYFGWEEPEPETEVDEAEALNQLLKKYRETDESEEVASQEKEQSREDSKHLEETEEEDLRPELSAEEVVRQENNLLKLMGLDREPHQPTYERQETAPDKIDVPAYGFDDPSPPVAKPIFNLSPKSNQTMTEAERSRLEARQKMVKESRFIQEQKRIAQDNFEENKKRAEQERLERQQKWNEHREKEQQNFSKSIYGRIEKLKKIQSGSVDKKEE